MERDGATLLEAWRNGDSAAGNELFERHFDAIYRFFRNKVGDDAADLVQQTFLSCVRSRDRFEGRSSFRTYLFVIARSRLHDHFRARARDPVEPDFSVRSVHDLGVSPSAVIAKREDNKLLVEALRRLPVDLQIALELYYVERLRAPELSEVLGVPLGTVRSRLRRGLQRLRVLMRELGASAERVATTDADLERWAATVRATPDTDRAR